MWILGASTSAPLQPPIVGGALSPLKVNGRWAIEWSHTAVEGSAAIAVVADALLGDEARQPAGLKECRDLRIGGQLSAAARVGYLIGSVVRQLLAVMLASGVGGGVVVGLRPPKDGRHGGE